MRDGDTIRCRQDGDIAVIRIDNPPVNTLTPEVRRSLIAALADIRASTTLRATILLGEGRGFIAGADLEELDTGVQSPDLWDLTQALEEGDKPIVAALHGFALGGGLAVALACDRHVATKTCTLGFPEVSLGLIPAFGATQYLTRIAGVEAALGLVTTGRRIDAIAALGLGLIDEITTPADVLTKAKSMARTLLATGTRRRPVGTRTLPPGDRDTALIAKAIEAVDNTNLTAPAQRAAIEAVEAARTLPLHRGVAREADLFARLVASPQSLELRRRFREERTKERVRS